MTKPVWAQFEAQADLYLGRAGRLLDIADRRRCKVLDSGGAQCTADGDTDHEHRYSEEDLP